MWAKATQTINWTRCIALAALIALGVPQATFAKDESSLVGRIASRPSNGAVGNWVVQGRTFNVSSATVLKEESGPLAVGACAEVKYTSQNNTDTATRIERQPESICGGSDDTGGQRQVYALIEAVPSGNVGTWRIGGQSYTSSAGTRLRQEHGAFAAGVCAEVEFTSANGTNAAQSISTEDAYRCGNATFLSRARGVVQSFPSGLVGDWQIGGANYVATASTQFQQRRPFSVGSCVEISYFIQNGSSIAQEIESEGADDCGPTQVSSNDLRKLYAPIEAFPATPFGGAWRAGGVDFSATSATRFEQNDAQFAVGACVEVKYVIDGNARQLVEVEGKPANRCQVNGASALRAYGAVDTLPAALLGTWQIGGVTYGAPSGTTFEQRFGRFAVGAFVEVVYRLEGNNRIATKIETHVAPGAGQISAVGALGARPRDDTGTWIIGGVAYQGDDSIEIELEHTARIAQAVLATNVVVNGYQGSDGTLFATSITAVRQTFLPLAQR